MLSNIAEQFPGISTQLVNFSSGKAIKAIKSGELDGGFVYGTFPEEFDSIEIKKQRITTISPIEFKATDDTLMTELASFPWITMGPDCPFDQFLKQKLGLKFTEISKVNDDNSRLELVKSGLGLSFYELEEALNYANQNQLKIFDQLDFEAQLYFVVAKNRIDEPVVKAMLQEVRVAWGIKL